MAETAVETTGLSKRYQLGRHPAQYETLREAISLRSLIRGRRERREGSTIWALRDVSLAIEEGESVGLIGPNGAGKTTLLRLLARITEPTLGMSRTRGRVGSLLEVGTGFHPELTGRDNVYLSGAILGMSRRDITRRFEAIVDFADVAAFLDTPLKRYSVGMQLRLAFAVAAHLEPDIVLIDEVLAVGDAEFQQRCLAYMSDLGQEGRTVVFVSHDLGAIQRLCARSIWIDGGKIASDGASREVVEAYLARYAPRAASAHFPGRSGRGVEVEWVGVTDQHGNPHEPRCDEPFAVHARFEVSEPIPDLDAAIHVMNSAGVRILDEAWLEAGTSRTLGASAGRLEASIHVPAVLAPGDYVVGLRIASSEECLFHEEVLTFRLRERPDDLRASTEKPRVIRSPSGLRLKELEPGPRLPISSDEM